jgi:hypothetical protein
MNNMGVSSEGVPDKKLIYASIYDLASRMPWLPLSGIYGEGRACVDRGSGKLKISGNAIPYNKRDAEGSLMFDVLLNGKLRSSRSRAI